MSDHTNDVVMIEERDGCLVARFLTDSLFDPLVVATVEKQLHEAVAEAVVPKVVMSLETVDHIASSTISTMISVRSACQGKGGDFALAGVPEGILKVLQVAHLDGVFRIHADANEAIAALNS